MSHCGADNVVTRTLERVIRGFREALGRKVELARLPTYARASHGKGVSNRKGTKADWFMEGTGLLQILDTISDSQRNQSTTITERTCTLSSNSAFAK